MLETRYDHLKVENGKYDFWLKNDYFKSGDLTKEPFCIVIPPPNVTGKLHLGHAWDTTLQDIITRYKKLNNFDTLWLPGMDHAGIATQAKVDERLKNEGLIPRNMDRNVWLNRAWDWKESYAKVIREQWSKLGLSLDYSKERFTLDEGLNNAVNEVFIKLYNKGLIYRGERIINFDPVAMTALSNIEVIYKEVNGAFYHLKYKLENSEEYIEVATTRPETLFGDTAVAVNPDDDRYKHLIGKNVVLPIVNKLIPIIADAYADMNFGTGAVKITPAHDPNDFEVGNRHNLERINCMNPNGTMNHNAFKYEGMDRFKCREVLLQELEQAGLLIKTTRMKHNVGFSERTDVMVEPYLSKQWFVKMKPLAEASLDNQNNKDAKVNFVPKRFEKIFTNWMNDIQDWCISRQLWWGHRIPAWYREDEVYVGKEAPKGEGWTQDTDVLDTWFSSALWPFSTLGWPNNFDKRYFPNDVLVTGYDIIFFWVSRMIFQSLEFTKERPFKEVLIHGLIRDKQGRKMSKSLGNGVDPMEVIETYGADSLRYFLATNSAPGQDLRYDEEKVKATWNFINKIWNAARFVMMNTGQIDNNETSNLNDIDKWIITKLNITIKSVRKNMDKYEFHNAGSELYSFIWNDFCDWYIELAKTNIENNATKATLLYVLESIIKMLHPFMPYVTEEIYQMLPNHKDSIMLSSYPTYDKKQIDDGALKNIDNIIANITKVRNTKQINNIGKEYFLFGKVFDQNKEIYQKLLKGTFVAETSSNLEWITISINDFEIKLGYQKLVDDNLFENLLKEVKILESNIARRTSLLNNEGYISKAPASLVETEKQKLIEEQQRLNIINEKLSKKSN